MCFVPICTPSTRPPLAGVPVVHPTCGPVVGDLDRAGVEPPTTGLYDEKALNCIAAVRGFFFCAPEGIRTPNLLIRSQVRYPLSYGRMFSCVGSEEPTCRSLRISVAEARGFEPPDPVKGQVISSDSHSAALAHLLGCRPSRTAEERDYTRLRPEGKTAGRRPRFARRSRKRCLLLVNA